MNETLGSDCRSVGRSVFPSDALLLVDHVIDMFNKGVKVSVMFGIISASLRLCKRDVSNDRSDMGLCGLYILISSLSLL